MTTIQFHGIHPDQPHGRRALRNPERGFRTEMYFSHIPSEIAGTCSCHSKQLKLDGRSQQPVYQNVDVPGVPHLIRGNRLDAVEFSHWQWQDELDYFAYDGVTIMQSYCFLMKYGRGEPLPDTKLADIEDFLNQVRQNHVKVLLRFAYELSPSLFGPTTDTIFKHLAQLEPLIRKHCDVIYVLQCGFVGKFGEFHNSYHYLQDNVDFYRQLFLEVCRVLPPSRRTMVRYPALKMHAFGTDPLPPELAFSDDPRARIGHFNDGFLAGPGHGGTFRRGDSLLLPEQEQAFLDAESPYLPMDGELFWRDVSGMALPTDAATLLARWHYDTFSFVHSHSPFEGSTAYSMDVWKNVPVDPMFLIKQKLPMSDGYFTDAHDNFVWRSYYEYIRDHLGYRLELQEATLPDTFAPAQPFSVSLKLINRGFSSPVNPRPVLLVLQQDHYRHTVAFDTDIQRWFGGNTPQTLSLTATLPADAPAGPYRCGLALPDAAPALRNVPEYAIRCANDLPFTDGINWLN